MKTKKITGGGKRPKITRDELIEKLCRAEYDLISAIKFLGLCTEMHEFLLYCAEKTLFDVRVAFSRKKFELPDWIQTFAGLIELKRMWVLHVGKDKDEVQDSIIAALNFLWEQHDLVHDSIEQSDEDFILMHMSIMMIHLLGFGALEYQDQKMRAKGVQGWINLLKPHHGIRCATICVRNALYFYRDVGILFEGKLDIHGLRVHEELASLKKKLGAILKAYKKRRRGLLICLEHRSSMKLFAEEAIKKQLIDAEEVLFEEAWS